LFETPFEQEASSISPSWPLVNLGISERKNLTIGGVAAKHWIPADMKHVLPRFLRPQQPAIAFSSANFKSFITHEQLHIMKIGNLKN
jgi:hypothetical protein